MENKETKELREEAMSWLSVASALDQRCSEKRARRDRLPEEARRALASYKKAPSDRNLARVSDALRKNPYGCGLIDGAAMGQMAAAKMMHAENMKSGRAVGISAIAGRYGAGSGELWKWQSAIAFGPEAGGIEEYGLGKLDGFRVQAVKTIRQCNRERSEASLSERKKVQGRERRKANEEHGER